MTDRGHNKWIACVYCCVLASLVLGGCGRSPFSHKVTFSDLESQDPLIKIRAIKWAGDKKLWEAVPPLVDSLQSQDEAVRFYAIEALRRIVGTDYDYDYKSMPHWRDTAVERWREFVASREWGNGEH